MKPKMPLVDEKAKSLGFYDVDEKDEWKPCIKCGGELTQERKAFFVCLTCRQEYIADEGDMKR